MNQRIKELIEQSEDPEHGFIIPEKFAELIVDEVYDYILNATFDDEPWPDRKDVKKHFGVEK